jgi:ATP/maltotriose-dependent transcriptional regulator MalT
LALPAAQDALEGAWELAREVGSYHWMRTSAGALAEVCAARGNLERAAAVLDEALPAGVPMRSFGQRHAWYGRAQLALAAGQPDEALRLACALGVRLDSLDAPHEPDEPDVVQAHFLAGRALAVLGRTDDAMRALRGARETTRVVGWRSLEWQISACLGALLRERGAEEAARRELARARELIDLLARTLDDEPLRDGFPRAALERLPEHAPSRNARLARPRRATV